MNLSINVPPKAPARHWIFWILVFCLSTLDLALLERKYNIFSGGFLQVHAITDFSQRLGFIAMVCALQAALAGCAWYAFLLFGQWRHQPQAASQYQFLFIYGSGNLILMAAKYQILSYFGDFLSLAVLKNLGGGSVQAALLYGLEESAFFGAACLAAMALCGLGWRQLARRQRAAWALSPPAQPPLRLAGKLLLCLAALLALALGAHQTRAWRTHWAKLTPYSLVANVLAPGWFAPVPARQRLLALAEGGAAPPAPHYQLQFPEQPDHLVLIVSESTRADVLDAQVDGQAATPVWRALAAQGSAARQYYSHTGFTTSSLKAIFRASLGNDLPLGGTLFEILKRQDYQIIVLSGQDESFGHIDQDSGAARSADIFFDARSDKPARVFASADHGSLTLSNARIVQEFDRIAPQIDWQRPVFIYINFQAAHFPYYHPGMPLTLTAQPLARRDIAPERSDALRRTYLNAVASSDASTGAIAARLERLGVAPRTLLAVSGDHGESLFDNGILGHGVAITEAQLHTLLLTSRPIAALAQPLGQTDLAPALLQGLGVRVTPAPQPGGPLIALIGDPQSPSALGYRYADGQRLTLDLAQGELRASWLAAPLALSALPAGSRELHEAQRLARQWRSLAGL